MSDSRGTERERENGGSTSLQLENIYIEGNELGKGGYTWFPLSRLACVSIQSIQNFNVNVNVQGDREREREWAFDSLVFV